MRYFAEPLVAIIFGAFMLCAETCLHVDSILHFTSVLDLPIHDWIAGVFLVVGGVVARRDWTRGRLYQAAAWGFMLSLLTGALLAHWSELGVTPDPDAWISETTFALILTGLTGVATGGLVSTIARFR